MRPVERIPEVLSSLKKVWEKYPDMRLGQLLMNIARLAGPEQNLFYIEDDELLKRLSRQNLFSNVE